jgi:hypothetical protein
MTFIVHHAKLLPTGDMYRVCGGTYPNEPDRTIGAFQSCPDMTWTADEPQKIVQCNNQLNTNIGVGPAVNYFPNHFPALLDGNQSVRLSRFFSHFENDFRAFVQQYRTVRMIWNCCSHMGLRPSVRGGEIGINSGQQINGYVHLNLTNGIVPSGKTTSLGSGL